MNFSWCKGPDVGLPRPDLVCFLSVSEQAALARADFGTERYEKIEFQNKVSTAAFRFRKSVFRIRIWIQSSQWIRILVRNPEPDQGGQQ
jgi:dTMP kinase